MAPWVGACRDIKPENLLLLKPRRATVIAREGEPTDNGYDSCEDDDVSD